MMPAATTQPTALIARIQIADRPLAESIAATVEATGDGSAVIHRDWLYLDEVALNGLRYVAEDAAGHYDGSQIWVGGTGYDVLREIDPEAPRKVVWAVIEELRTRPDIAQWLVPGSDLAEDIFADLLDVVTATLPTASTPHQ